MFKFTGCESILKNKWTSLELDYEQVGLGSKIRAWEWSGGRKWRCSTLLF